MPAIAEPTLVVLTGPMFAEKSGELLRRRRLFRVAKMGVILFRPSKDTRSELEICRDGDESEIVAIDATAVVSRNGDMSEAVLIDRASEIFEHVNNSHSVVLVDEGHFFSRELAAVAMKLVRMGKHVVVTGLDLDFAENPFETMAALMCVAPTVIKLYAVCTKCDSLRATRSQRLVDSKEAVVVGDREYEARCLNCYVLPKS